MDDDPSGQTEDRHGPVSGKETPPADYDLVIIGGGIQGVAMARDAAGRGLRTAIIERHDLGGATSSASSKLIHGGIRYLEQGEFGLVRESLDERSRLLRAAPHLVRPLRFIVPCGRGSRPAWMVRAGLWLYDRLARHRRLGPSRRIPLPPGLFKPGFHLAFAYWDARGDDARLVVANALDATQRGADLHLHTDFESARVAQGLWQVEVRDRNGRHTFSSLTLANCCGPWAAEVQQRITGARAIRMRPVQGSHLVLPRLLPGDSAVLLQNDDGRVLFLIPFEREFTLVGTTDWPLDHLPEYPSPQADEAAYLCAAVSHHLKQTVTPEDIRWQFAGVRPLADEPGRKPSEVKRGHHVISQNVGGAPLVTLVGGKLTLHRAIAEELVNALPAARLPHKLGPWTAASRLPGSDLSNAGSPDLFADELAANHPDLPDTWLRALVSRHGSRARDIVGEARQVEDLGQHFGSHLYACEVAYLMREEWACTADDVLWRRTKYGLHINDDEKAALADWMASHQPGA